MGVCGSRGGGDSTVVRHVRQGMNGSRGGRLRDTYNDLRRACCRSSIGIIIVKLVG